MKVLELYSGIGGMHLALQASGVKGEVKASIEINTTAISVYKHNFPETNLLNRNIQSLTAKFVNDLGVDTILMSPPCQPFTRNGLKRDVDDARTDSFVHVLNLLPELCIERILIENVKGFEVSEMHEKLLRALRRNGFRFKEFILSPVQFGVPNSRRRYYCLAKRNDFDNGALSEDLPCDCGNFDEPFEISRIIDEGETFDYLIPEKLLLKRAKILDICYKNSRRSCCFTKAYGRYIEGTGSVFTDKSEDETKSVYAELENLLIGSTEYMECIKKLNLRFFTPKEVTRLMSFPESFDFPEETTRKQRYALLGNSVNVKVVSELIKLLN